MDAIKDDSEAASCPNAPQPSPSVQQGARRSNTTTRQTVKRSRRNTEYQSTNTTPVRPQSTTVYIDIEQDLTLESVILSSEYNGSAPPPRQHQQLQDLAMGSSDDDNSFTLEYESGESCDDGDGDDVDDELSQEVFASTETQQSQLQRNSPPLNKFKNNVMAGPQSPSDIDLRASFSTLLHGKNYTLSKKKCNSGADRMEHKSSSVRLNTVCLVPESEMEQRRVKSSKFKAETGGKISAEGGESRSRGRKNGTTSTQQPGQPGSTISRSTRSSRSSSISTSDLSSSRHRRRRRSSNKPPYDSGKPFGQVDLSTVSLAAAGISLVAGLSFSAGYALGRRSDVHLAVVS